MCMAVPNACDVRGLRGSHQPYGHRQLQCRLGPTCLCDRMLGRRSTIRQSSHLCEQTLGTQSLCSPSVFVLLAAQRCLAGEPH